MNSRILRILALWLALGVPAFASQATLVTPSSPLSMNSLAAFLNNALLSVGSCNSGNGAPTNGPGAAAFPGQCWINTTSNPWIFSYTADGTHWSQFGTLNTSSFVWTPFSNGVGLTTGTAGATVPLNNGGFTQSGLANFTGGIQVNGNASTGSGGVVLANAPTITSPVLTSTSPFQFTNGANAQAAYAAALCAASSFTICAATPTNGFYTSGGVAFAGSSSGVTQLNAASSASGTLTLPAVTDTLLAQAAAQPMTNKTFNCANNTCTIRLGSDVTGTLLAASFPALTGDLTTIAGSLATTLASVNSNVGSFGTATAVPFFTVNAKGLITAAGTNNIPTASASVKGLVQGDGATLSISGGVASCTTATGSQNGCVHPDGTTVTVNGAGALTAVGAAASSIDASGATAISNGTSGCVLVDSSGKVSCMMPGPLTNSIGANVLLNVTSGYFDGPTVAQGTTGTWWVSGTVTISSTLSEPIYCKLWDGTTVIAASSLTTTAGGSNSLTLSGYLTSPAGNLRMSCRDPSSTNGSILANNTGNGFKDSTISAHRIQ